MIYKLVSKFITNRLKLLMDSIILNSQSAFILEPIITDNILITRVASYHKEPHARKDWVDDGQVRHVKGLQPS